MSGVVVVCDDALNVERPGAEAVVPEALPPMWSDAPKRVWGPRGLWAIPGVVLFWLMPRRFGCAFANAGWLAPIVAHCISVTLMIGWALYLFYVERTFGAVEAGLYLEAVRMPFVVCFNEIGLHPGESLLSILMIEMVVLLSAFGVMPLAASGENAPALFGRCLRMSLWSTTIAVPFAFLLLWIFQEHAENGLAVTTISGPVRNVEEDCAAFAAVFFLTSQFHLLLSVLRYAGPPDGAGWEPRTPRCEACGYALAGLSASGRCPECGVDVSESYPSQREVPRFFRSKSDGPRRCPAPFTFSIIFNKRFFSHLAIHEGHALCRTLFFLRMVLVIALLVAVLFGMDQLRTRTSHLWVPVFVGQVSPLVGVFCAVCILSGPFWPTSALAWVFSMKGRRPFYEAAFVAMYASAAWLPLVLGVAAVYFGYAALASTMMPDLGRTELAWLYAGTGAGFVGGTWLILAGVACLRRAFRDTRLASA